jgi:hypothetical protein
MIGPDKAVRSIVGRGVVLPKFPGFPVLTGNFADFPIEAPFACKNGEPNQ